MSDSTNYKELIDSLVKSIESEPKADRLSDIVLATLYTLKRASPKEIRAEINKTSENKVKTQTIKKWLGIFEEMGTVKKVEEDSYAMNKGSFYYRTFVLVEEK